MKAIANNRRILKTIAILMLCLAVAVAILVGLYYGLPAKLQTEGVNPYVVKKVENKAELTEIFNRYKLYQRESRPFTLFSNVAKNDSAELDGDLVTAPTDNGVGGSKDDFSTTNTQVGGIDEADAVKTDGNYLYVLSATGINIISVNGGAMQKVSTIDVEAESFYIYNNYVVAIGRAYVADSGAEIFVYDTQDKANPTLVRSVAHSGYFITTRLKEGVIYYVVRDYQYYNNDTPVPYVRTNLDDGKKEMPIDNIYYFDGIPERSYLIIGKIDLNDSQNDDYKAYLGAGNDIYMSHYNLYVTSRDSSERYYTNGLRNFISSSATVKTRILKFDLQSLEFKYGAGVAGVINDRYCLDEYDGNLRVATTIGNMEYSQVTILNEKLEEIGKTPHIAPGERIYSARFNGTSASIVTFRTVDPLFKVDLTDPTNPTVSKGLKKEGVSYYLHFVEGTDLLIGLGYDTVDGTTKGIEVALFDNSGADAVIINCIIIGSESAYAEAIYNPQAILYDKDRDMFGFAATVYNYGANGYSQTESYYLFGFMSGELKLRANIMHDATLDSRYEVVGSDMPYSSNYFVKRAVQVGDYLYSISNRLVVSHSINDEFTNVQVIEI
ncbi:MAG: beta-propeller domain-containing protein [Clostridia bacterium]|nr:beta-propeller domain-containing protein [Clostridia bacterium]